MSEDARDGWEDEGGATAPEPKQRLPKSREAPVPTAKQIVEGFRVIVQPRKKKPKP